MPKDLKDFPRPPSDNGRGLVGSASTGWSGGKEGYDFWIGELVAMGVKWFKLLDTRNDSVPFCEKLVAAGIFPIVRIVRSDPPPNDSPEPNPGHINVAEEEMIRRLIAAGVRYFETNNEPDLTTEWKNAAMPGDSLETAKLVALNWLFDARFILAAGGYPGLPAITGGGNMDLMGALVALGRQDILLEGCWIALHNDAQNRPIEFPDDPVNRSGQPITPSQHDAGAYAQWTWWNNSTGRADTVDEINTMRAAAKHPTQTIQQNHACFREFEYYDSLAMKYLGRSIPIISTEGGYRVGRREDARYPRITPDSHRDLTVALFDYMQRQAPDYYFAAVPRQMVESEGDESAAWYSAYWKRTLPKGSNVRAGFPTIAVTGVTLGDQLPVVDAVKAMPNLARRMPGVQPAPPSLQPAVTAPAQLAPLKYVVSSGDTLSKIAKQFGTTWQNIAALNQLATPDLLRVGQTLLIPRVVDSAPAAAPEATVVPPALARPGLSALFAEDEPAPTQPGLSSFYPDDEPAPIAAPLMPPPPAPESIPVIPVSAEPPRPVVPPAPVADIPPPAPILTPPPRLPDPSATPLELEWDWRLDALGAAVKPAAVDPGHAYWKLVGAVYQAPDESGGNHHIYYTVWDEHAQPLEFQRVWQGWPDDKTDAMTNERGEANIPLWASYAPDRGESGSYFAWVDGLPSDRVYGLGLPLKRHVNFLLTWQRTIR
ncbi:MAG TPA: LysM peptidoglycan-binding domain-containing protein [Anaerolineae bacterium]